MAPRVIFGIATYERDTYETAGRAGPLAGRPRAAARRLTRRPAKGPHTPQLAA